MKTKSIWLMMSCLAVVAMLMASCAPAQEGVWGPEPPKGPPQYGGTYTLLTSYYTLDHLSFDHADMQWMHNYTAGPYQEGLVMGDLEKYGPTGTNEFSFDTQAYIPDEYLTGALAESWELETDPMRMVFHIRPGVMWQGKPGVMEARELTAEDVKFSWERTVSSPRAIPHYYDWIDSFEAPDKYTLVVNMNAYNANWGYLIGWGYYTLISPPELAEEDEDGKAKVKNWKNACGTGPFMLTDYVKGSYTIYERNPNYWGTTTIDGKEYQLPFVDKMVWPIIADEPTALAAVRSGQADVVWAVAWKDTASLDETCPDLRKWQIHGRGLKTCVAMNVNNPPLDDVKVRQALSMAVDRQAMLDRLNGGMGVLFNFPFSADWELYTPLEELPESAREVIEYNPEKAKQLLAEAGYPDGFECELVFFSATQIARDQADMLQDNLADIGVDLKLNAMGDYGAYIGIMFSRRYDYMYMVGHGEGNPFSVLRKSLLPKQTWNVPDWIDYEYEEKVLTARAEIDEAKRNAALKELNIYPVEQCPYIILPTGDFYRYAWPWVGNFYGQGIIGAVNGSGGQARVWIDQEKKKAMGY
ncbi:MAG: ABC transporter substrate-binding protein [Dehalococcoidia bacterium]|nr:ABC transporter substrate-binding protein [Dehalococcoidia bacterium]